LYKKAAHKTLLKLAPGVGLPLQLPALDLDLATAGLVGRVLEAADLRADLLQVGRGGHANDDLIHRN